MTPATAPGLEPAESLRVLHSFPHKIGAGRICHIGWQQVAGAAAAGARVTSYPGVVHRALPDGVEVKPTLARGRFRIPYRAIGHARAYTLHDQIVARRLETIRDRIDVVHVWPSGALHTLRAARRLGIPTVLERPNTHTRFAYDVVAAESRRLGIELPANYEHAYNHAALMHEEQEYDLADYLLCPSEFVEQTFVDEGFGRERLLRHRYGYDPSVFQAGDQNADSKPGLTALFAGLSAVRKGLHFALDAWIQSPASQKGTFLIAGSFLPAYRQLLESKLAHRSVQILGQRDDVAALMRSADIFMLPSIEEGYPLVCVEARASGCVPLVSRAAAEACVHDENGLVHEVGDVNALTEHLTVLHEDRAELRRLREASLATASDLTWDNATDLLMQAYDRAATGAPRAVASPR